LNIPARLSSRRRGIFKKEILNIQRSIFNSQQKKTLRTSASLFYAVFLPALFSTQNTVKTP